MRDVVGIWLGGLDGSTWWERDADEQVLAASLMKVPVAMAAEALDLDRSVPVHPDFESVVLGESFELDEAGDQDPDTWADVGGERDLRELRRRSIVHSGNLASNLVVEQTGIAAVTAVMPQVLRMIGDQPATDAGLVNAASARQWGELLTRVAGSYDDVEDVMRGQTYRDGIPAGLPPGTPVANKTGWIDDHTHDMAIVRPPDAEAFALVVLTRLAGVRTDEGSARITAVAREAWGAAALSAGATVERIEVEPLSVPLHTPFVTALRRATSVETVVVRVTDSDGRVGLGEAPQNWQVLGASVAGSAACLEGPLRDAVLGRSADPFETWPVIDRAVAGNGPAKAALDCALHDLARDGSGPLTVPTLVTVPVGEPDEIAEAAQARVAEGFRTLKLKVGTDAATDVARVRAAREGAGPDVALRVDANTGWDCFEAVRVVRALEDAGVALELVEQPVGRRDLMGLAHVRRHVATPVMADESLFDLDDLVELVRHDAADLVNVKIPKAGGITPALELVRAARAHGLGVSVGCMLESAVGVSAAAALAVRAGCDVDPDLDGAWWLAEGAPYADRVTYVEGRAVVG